MRYIKTFADFTTVSVLVFAVSLLVQVVLVLTCVPAFGDETLSVKAIHPETRIEAGPANGLEVAKNPPALLWPVKSRKAQYVVRMSQDRSFPSGGTIISDKLRWAMFNPHKRLRTGRWYWQYETFIGGRKTAESDIFDFEVTRSATVFETPSTERMLAACPDSHPRVLITKKQIPPFRRRVKDMAEAKQILRAAKRCLGGRMPDEASGKAKKKGEDRKQASQFAKWASKGLASSFAGTVRNLCMAYIISGDERFADEAKRRGLHIAGWDPDGVTAPNVSDFADGECLNALALSYDTCYDKFNKSERNKMLVAIDVRAGRMFGRWTNSLETRVFSAHIWQHILLEFTRASFATLNETPDSNLWAAYVYDLWTARFPLIGGDDGGWANGSSYFRTNFRTICEISAFFGDLTGTDFFDNAWFRNAPYYMMYVWSPGSVAADHCDGVDRQLTPPTPNWIAFADALARKNRDPVAAWYVKQAVRDRGDSVSRDSSLAWYRLRYYDDSKRVEPAAEFDLPQARLFRDIGEVAMHTDLAHASNDLSVVFRSSPYGSWNHAHDNQNDFNINFGGSRMFHNTGYYIAYGDPHYRGWYKNTRGHNCILIDGKGQQYDTPDGYGWIPRFLNGEHVAYCTGDASNAYPKGSGLTKWRRHMVLLRPSTVLIYDDLEADHPSEWQWLLHSGDPMKRAGGPARFAVDTKTGRGEVNLFASGAFDTHIGTKFDPPADNWRGKKDPRTGKLYVYPDQYHLTVTPKTKTAAARFLAVIEIQPHGKTFNRPVTEHSGQIDIGSWHINAQMDASKKARLTVRDTDGTVALTVDSDRSVLEDVMNGRRTKQIVTDQLPAAAKQYAIRDLE